MARRSGSLGTGFSIGTRLGGRFGDCLGGFRFFFAIAPHPLAFGGGIGFTFIIPGATQGLNTRDGGWP
jgi:hypothetical protein